MASIGQQLTTPETGMRRINITTTNVTTNMQNGAIPESYKGDAIYSGIGGYVRFNVYTQRLTIISIGHSTGNSNVKLRINGIQVATMSNYKTTRTGCLVVYSESFDSKKVSSIEIIVDEVGEFDLDCIDVDSDGYLIPYNTNITKYKICKNVNEMVIGDMIPCRYSAKDSSVPGIFS